MTREKRNEYARNRYAALRALRRCMWCAQPVEPGKTLCSKCLMKQAMYNEQRKKLKEERYARGLCVCGRELHPGYKACCECLLKNRERIRKYRAQIRSTDHQRKHLNGDEFHD
jgi:predicted nucleic acid-binding Zn ribbon protein